MKRKAYMKSCEISEVRTVRLGGYDQKISIEGKKRDLPVVICLHGGPGLPVPFGVGCRGLMPEWTDRAIMVYWDQLGCGINTSSPSLIMARSAISMASDPPTVTMTSWL